MNWNVQLSLVIALGIVSLGNLSFEQRDLMNVPSMRKIICD